MGTTKFKTTLKCSGCVATVTPFLDAAVGKNNWKVDLNSPSKIMTVEDGNDPQKVVQAMERAGYKAEVFKE
jgi:copper chaperone